LAASVKLLKLKVVLVAGTSLRSMVELPAGMVTRRAALKTSVPAKRVKTWLEAPEKALWPEVYSANGGVAMPGS
jgi:hypothetical protein